MSIPPAPTYPVQNRLSIWDKMSQVHIVVWAILGVVCLNTLFVILCLIYVTNLARIYG